VSPRHRRRTVTPAGPGDLAAETFRAAENRLDEGRIDEACALGQVAAAQAPGLAAVWEFLGRCYMRLPDPERARAAYRKYLELAPDAPRASLIRAMVERESQ
jgi:Flp pilus assembly protein TadD